MRKKTDAWHHPMMLIFFFFLVNAVLSPLEFQARALLVIRRCFASWFAVAEKAKKEKKKKKNLMSIINGRSYDNNMIQVLTT